MIASRYHYHTRKTLALFDTDVIIHKSVWFNVYLYIIVRFLSHVRLNLRYSTPFNIYSIKYDNENDDRSDRCNYVYVNALTFKFLYSTKLSLHPQKMQHKFGHWREYNGMNSKIPYLIVSGRSRPAAVYTNGRKHALNELSFQISAFQYQWGGNFPSPRKCWIIKWTPVKGNPSYCVQRWTNKLGPWQLNWKQI